MIRVVGVSEMKMSADPEDVLVTYALGSCLGVAIYDPVARVGGLLHAMLPLSTIDPDRGVRNPFHFVDTGVPRLFIESYRLGARKERIVLIVAGGASRNEEEEGGYFQIGQRNIIMLRKLLWKNGVLMKKSDLGGCVARTMSLFLKDGAVSIISNGERNALTEVFARQSEASI